MAKIFDYVDGKLVVDFSLIPESYELNIKVCGNEQPGVEVTIKSNVTYMRHGMWNEKIDSKLQSLPGARHRG